ncbi:MAG: YbaN family protein [Vicinamibacterales bacterium]
MSSHVRWVRATGGIICFALGAIGAVVPLMPTTVFLIGGSYLLVGSVPALEQRLRALPLFQPYVRYLDPSVPLSPRARVTALAGMWTSIAVSTTVVHLSGAGGPLFVAAMLGLGSAGTGAILLFRRPARAMNSRA